MRVLLTGASGFVGRALLSRLQAENEVVAVVRQGAALPSAGVRRFELHGGLEQPVCWAPALHQVDVVVHAAARVHVLDGHCADPLALYRSVNVTGTLHLAREAAAAGVRRFIFISSIKVNGEGTVPGRPYTADDAPRPTDPYGVSKLEAEQGLLALAAEGEMEVVIIRPVLVYGPGVKANFRSMMSWLCKKVPLPLGSIRNKRSLVALDNLVDLIVVCLDHPAAANQVFLVSDGEDLSTTELLVRMGAALGKPACLLPIPVPLLEVAARLLGKQAIAQRLCGSLQVDMEKTRVLLGWQPPFTVEQMLAKTASGFLEAE